MSRENNVTVSDFLNNEYIDYSFYVLEERAIPSMIDGLKPTQRKIIYVADKHIRNVSNKVATLAGKVISDAKYHHGNVSVEGSIVNMSQKFKNNLPLFDSIGQFGSLKSPIASAARYISVKMSKNFDMVYKDKELLTYKYEEGDKIEPNYYLPIIPIVLTNGAVGIAVGFATNILKRDLKDVVKKCISYLEGKKFRQIKMCINDFVGDFIEDVEKPNKWYIKGILKIENSNYVNIRELPPSMTYKKFETHLDDLNDSRKIIDWENHSEDGKIDYRIKFTREELSRYDETKLMKLFKLVDQETENFTVLDEDGKLKLYNNAEDILKDFVDFRVTYYEKRKKHLLNKAKNDIEKLSNRAKFIKAIIDAKILINKKNRKQIEQQIVKHNIGKNEDSYDYLLSMPIYSLSKEKYEELLQNIKDKKEYQKEIKKSVPKDVYLNELNELLKKV